MLDLIIFFLSFVLITLVAGNNLSACSGAMISGRVVSKRFGILLTVLGYILGLALQGQILKGGLYSLLPNPSPLAVSVALFIAVIVFIYSYLKKVPQSLSMTFSSAILGISLASGFKTNVMFLASMFSFWILAPLVSIVLVLFLMRVSNHIVNKRHVWRTVGRIRTLLIIVSFLTAFTLGANTMGLLYASLPESVYNLPLAITGIIIGSFLLSGRGLRRISNDIITIRYLNSLNSQFASTLLVEIATLFGIPLSNTQIFTTSVYGAGLSYKNRIIKKKPAKEIVYFWIVMIAASFVLGYLIFSAVS